MSVNPNAGGASPLAGVRVLAFTQLGAGPYAMTLLADLGADVVKVEDPSAGGDEARRVPPFADAAAADGLYYQALNRRARRPTLHLRAPDGPPTRSGVSVVDFAGGMLSALALMIGLHRARETGTGCDLDVSLFDAALSMLNYLAVWTLNRDWHPARLADGAHQSLVPSQRFPTRDGWIVVMCMKE